MRALRGLDTENHLRRFAQSSGGLVFLVSRHIAVLRPGIDVVNTEISLELTARVPKRVRRLRQQGRHFLKILKLRKLFVNHHGSGMGYGGKGEGKGKGKGKGVRAAAAASDKGDDGRAWQCRYCQNIWNGKGAQFCFCSKCIMMFLFNNENKQKLIYGFDVRSSSC